MRRATLLAGGGTGLLFLWLVLPLQRGADAQVLPSAVDKTTSWQHPKTPWGDPDLQGMWPSGAMSGTPFERPPQFGERAFVNDEEFAERRKQFKEAFERFVLTQFGEPDRQAQRQASLLVEPGNGRLPPLTPEGLRRSATLGSSRQFEERQFDSIEDFDTWDRCITRGLPSSMLPAQYGNGTEILQAPGYVVIRNEMVHEARIIPLDGRPHVGAEIKQYMGDSRGRWDGNTLIIETTNFNGRVVAVNAGTSGSPRMNNVPTSTSMKLVERFNRIGEDTLNYEARIADPTIFAREWVVAFPLARDPDYYIFEYACHENNYSLRNMLSAARAAEK